ncbi:MAG: hypothetical protein ACLVHH_03330 [Faecalibacillus intestinalis]|uniref:hypothetical protein n=1 Tax=Faecalibacillus intestinalis TaxID=1982626 RepID=UPI00399AB0D6
MQNLIKMYAGEKRKIRLFVHSKKKPEDTFIIRNAKAEIYLYGDLMQTIECEIDEHDLIFLLGIEESGNYKMIITMLLQMKLLKINLKLR